MGAERLKGGMVSADGMPVNHVLAVGTHEMVRVAVLLIYLYAGRRRTFSET